MNFTNLAPAAPTNVIAIGGTKQITISWDACPDYDYQSTLVQLSSASAGPYTGSYETTGNTITISGLAQTTTYWVRVAHTDTFGKTGLNWSNPVATITDNFNSLVDSRIGTAIINGGQLLAGTLPQAALSTEALYAPLAVIGDTTNLIRNGIGDRGNSGWLVCSPTAIKPFNWNTFTSLYAGTACLTFDDRDHLYGEKIPVKTGDEFWASMWCIPRGGGTLNYNCGIGFIGYAADGITQTEYQVVQRPSSQGGVSLLAGALAVTNSATCTIWPWVWINKLADTTNTGTTGNGLHATQIQLQRRNKGELIVDGSITGNKLLANTVTADKIDTRNLTIKDASGNILFGSGTNLNFSNINASANWLNSNIGVDGNGYLTGAGTSVQVANNVLSQGSNLCYNSDWSNGLDGWIWGGQAGIAAAGVSYGKNLSPSWRLSPSGTKGSDVAYIQQPGRVGDPSKYIELFSMPINVVAGKRYISSGYTGAHRCKVAIFAYFYDVLDNNISHSYNAEAENAEQANGGQLLSGYKRNYSFLTAPAGASYARMVVRKYDTNAGQPDSYAFFTRLQFEQGGDNAVYPGPYCDSGISDPTNVRSNNPINAANISTYIAGAAIGYAQMGSASVGTLQVQDEAVTNSKIKNLAVDNAKIANLAVTTGKIANLAVDTLQIANQAVTIPVSVYNTGTTGTSSYADHVSATIISSGAPIMIFTSAVLSGSASMTSSGYNTVGVYVGVQVKRDGVVILNLPRCIYGSGSGSGNASASAYGTYCFNIADTPGAGTHTYTLTVTVSGTSNLSAAISNGSICLLETKK